MGTKGRLAEVMVGVWGMTDAGIEVSRAPWSVPYFSGKWGTVFLEHDPLDLVQADVVARPVVELGRSG
jgi:hypothetical protein